MLGHFPNQFKKFTNHSLCRHASLRYVDGCLLWGSSLILGKVWELGADILSTNICVKRSMLRTFFRSISAINFTKCIKTSFLALIEYTVVHFEKESKNVRKYLLPPLHSISSGPEESLWKICKTFMGSEDVIFGILALVSLPTMQDWQSFFSEANKFTPATIFTWNNRTIPSWYTY